MLRAKLQKNQMLARIWDIAIARVGAELEQWFAEASCQKPR